MTVQASRVLPDLIAGLRSLYGPRLLNVVLFGSQARGDADSGSDIDILVVLADPVDPGLEIGRTGALSSELSLQHDAVVSLVFVPLSRYLHEKSPLLLNIRREGVAL
jgi:predicted nucleotidyltransferase